MFVLRVLLRFLAQRWFVLCCLYAPLSLSQPFFLPSLPRLPQSFFFTFHSTFCRTYQDVWSTLVVFFCYPLLHAFFFCFLRKHHSAPMNVNAVFISDKSGSHVMHNLVKVVICERSFVFCLFFTSSLFRHFGFVLFFLCLSFCLLQKAVQA